MNTFSDAEYGGIFVRLPTGLADRLVTAGRNHLARQSRYVDPDADPVAVLEQWLHQLERARVLPTPQPETGDLLIKIARGETWMLTSDDWRELAPLELQTDVATEADTITGAHARSYENIGGGVSGKKSYVEEILNDFPGAVDEPEAVWYTRLAAELRAMEDPLSDFANAVVENESPGFDAAAAARMFRRGLEYARITAYRLSRSQQGVS